MSYQSMIKDEKEQYYMIKPPMVMIGKDKEAIILNLIKCLTIDYKKALLFYNHLCFIASGEEYVYDYMLQNAQKWHDTGDQSILDYYQHGYNIQNLLDYWYKEFNLRMLYLLGLTNKEIKPLGMTCDDIYNQCLINP